MVQSCSFCPTSQIVDVVFLICRFPNFSLDPKDENAEVRSCRKVIWTSNRNQFVQESQNRANSRSKIFAWKNHIYVDWIRLFSLRWATAASSDREEIQRKVIQTRHLRSLMSFQVEIFYMKTKDEVQRWTLFWWRCPSKEKSTLKRKSKWTTNLNLLPQNFDVTILSSEMS